MSRLDLPAFLRLHCFARAPLAPVDLSRPTPWEVRYAAWRDGPGAPLSRQMRREAQHVAGWLDRHPQPTVAELREEMRSQALALTIAADEVEEMEGRLWRATRPAPSRWGRLRRRLRSWARRAGIVGA